MADAKVPLVGGVNKTTLYVAGAAGVAAVGYAVWKKKKAAAAAAATPTATTAYGYAAYGYGSELTDEEQGIASEYAYEGYSYGGIGAYGIGTSEPSTNNPVATNAEWAQYAQQFLVNQGYTATTVANALGAYITGSNVGDNESIVQAAIAFEGYPPAAGSGGYPPSINTGGTNTGQGGGTGTTPAKSTAANPISNLAVTRKSATSVAAKWNPSTGATGGYSWKLTGPVNKSGTTKSTSVTVSGLKKGSYNFGIQALPGGFGDNASVTV